MWDSELRSANPSDETDGTLNALQHTQPMYLTRPDGTVVVANDAYRALMEMPSAARPANDRVEHLAEQHRRIVGRVTTTGEAVVQREIFRSLDDDRTCLARHAPVLDKDRTIIAVAGCLIDITGSAGELSESRRERQRFSDITRASSDWIWETDTNGRISFISQRIAAITGLPARLMKGRQIADFCRIPGRTVGQGRGIAVMDSRKPFRNVHVEVFLRSGDPLPHYPSGVPHFDEAGRFAGYRGTGTDVTDLLRAQDALTNVNRRLEDALKELTTKNEELDQALDAAVGATRAKDQFLAAMSHELRTPLTAILGFSEVMSLGLFGELTEKYQSYVSNILQSGQHLLNLVDDILDITRIESGALPLTIETVWLKSVIEEAKALIENIAREKDLDLSEVTIDRDFPAVGDRTRCLQIFNNLLSNAVKFTPNGGSISVRATTVDEPKPMVEVSVCDTGRGIPSDMIDSIFETFSQVKVDPESASLGGAGIGLALTRRLIHLMEGEVRVESELGKGSCFTVSLPLKVDSD